MLIAQLPSHIGDILSLAPATVAIAAGIRLTVRHRIQRGMIASQMRHHVAQDAPYAA